MTEENPYLAPETPPGAELAPEEILEEAEWEDAPAYEYAGFLRRAMAKAIDIFSFGIAVMFMLGIFAGIKHGILAADANDVLSDIQFYDGSPDSEFVEPVGLSNTRLNIIFTTTFIIFAGFVEWYSGQSLGKLLFGLQVVADGPPALPSLGMALGRNVGLIFDGMFLGVFAWMVMRTNPRQQRAGDIGAHTLVVRKRSIPGSSLSTSKNILLGLTIGVGFIVATALLLVILDPTM